MKIYNQRISRTFSASTAALIAVIFYIIIAVALNLIQSVIDPTGDTYNEAFGIIQLIIVTLYWIGINYYFFSRPGRTGVGAIVTYLVFTILPIALFTIASICIVEFYPTTDFILSWNLLTWVISPTIFWYLPYSYIYYAFGYSFSLTVFMGVILIYNIAMIFIGIILGLARYSYASEKKAIPKRKQKKRISQNEPVTIEAIPTESSEENLFSNEVLGLAYSEPEEQELDEFDMFMQQPIEEEFIGEKFETITLNEEIDRISEAADTYAFDEPIIIEEDIEIIEDEDLE